MEVVEMPYNRSSIVRRLLHIVKPNLSSIKLKITSGRKFSVVLSCDSEASAQPPLKLGW